MKKSLSESKPITLSVNLDKMIQKAEKNPKPGSCPVVDVLVDLMAMGYKEWEKKYRPHKRQKPNK